MTAINAYGLSTTSEPGSGATIITYPSSPLSFCEDTSKRTATSVGLEWQVGTSDGGSPIIDFEVYYDSTSNGLAFSVLATNILSTDYLASELSTGQTYQFKVAARNAFGLSASSEAISLLIATKPA